MTTARAGGRQAVAAACVMLALAASGTGCGALREARERREAERLDATILLHVRALGERAAGHRATAQRLFEEACRRGHEPACAEIFTRADVGVDRTGADARRQVEQRADEIARAADGVCFLHDNGRGLTVRVYCPPSREADLKLALSRLSREDAQRE